MFTPALLILLNGMFYMLRISGGGSFPKPLTAEEESFWLKKYADGDTEARNVLVERNLRLVAHIIKKYYTQTDEQEDLVSIGTIGLIKGISTFNSKKGARLATYAARCIENEILMYFRSRRKSMGDVSLSEVIETGRDGGTLSLIDVISSDEDMLESISTQDLCSKLRGAMSRLLSPTEERIILLRYGLDAHSPRTQREIAELCGISRSYVSRLEKRALEKLRTEFDVC